MTNLKQLVDDFMLTIEACGDVESEKTVKFNRRRMRFFVEFIKSENITDPLTARTLRQYAVYLKNRPRNDGRPGKLSAHYPTKRFSVLTCEVITGTQ